MQPRKLLVVRITTKHPIGFLTLKAKLLTVHFGLKENLTVTVITYISCVIVTNLTDGTMYQQATNGVGYAKHQPKKHHPIVSSIALKTANT
jgi:hypothetical protein